MKQASPQSFKKKSNPEPKEDIPCMIVSPRHPHNPSGTRRKPIALREYYNAQKFLSTFEASRELLRDPHEEKSDFEKMFTAVTCRRSMQFYNQAAFKSSSETNLHQISFTNFKVCSGVEDVKMGTGSMSQ